MGATQEWQSHIEERGRGEFREREEETSSSETEVARIDSWARDAFRARDTYELQNIGPNVGQWIRGGLKPAWVQEALLTGAANDPGHIVRYANGCLRNWRKKGQSTSEETAAKAASEKSRDALPVVTASPNSPWHKHSREAYAKRRQQQEKPADE